MNIDSTFFIILKMAQSQRKQTSRKWTKAGRDMTKTYRCPLRPGKMGNIISAGLQWELVAYSVPSRVSKENTVSALSSFQGRQAASLLHGS